MAGAIIYDFKPRFNDHKTSLWRVIDWGETRFMFMGFSRRRLDGFAIDYFLLDYLRLELTRIGFELTRCAFGGLAFVMFILGGPRQGGGGGDVETARVVMRLFRGRCAFFSPPYFICVAQTLGQCCPNAHALSGR